MDRRSYTLFAAALVIAVAASFVTGRVMRSRQSTETNSAGWLQDAPTEVRQADLQFNQQAVQLAGAVMSQKGRLCAMLADASTTGQQILEQADRVTESNAALVRAVAGHVVGLRTRLPEPQKQGFMSCCAGCLRGRGMGGYCYRGGMRNQAGQMGRGAGREWMWRNRGGAGGQCFADRLQLMAQQTALLQTQDPNFNDEAANLVQKLDQARAALLAGFENGGIASEELMARADNMAAAQSELEKRVARHVAILHATLSPQQRQVLAQLVNTRGIDAESTGG